MNNEKTSVNIENASKFLDKINFNLNENQGTYSAEWLTTNYIRSVFKGIEDIKNTWDSNIKKATKDYIDNVEGISKEALSNIPELIGIKVETLTSLLGKGEGVITGGYVNFRTGASTSSKVLSVLRKGENVTVIEKSGNWVKVKTSSGQEGYINSKYIDVKNTPTTPPKTTTTQTSTETTTTTSTSTAKVTANALNVRTGASTSNKVLSVITKGDSVTVLSKSGSWAKVRLANGTEGYVSTKYIK